MSSEAKLNCCSCGAIFSESHISGVTVYTCKNCDGVWVPYASMAHLVKMEPLGQSLSVIVELQPKAGAMPRNCPSCSVASLGQVLINDIELDLCDICKGIFFDKSEIEATFPKLSESRGSADKGWSIVIMLLGEIVAAAISTAG